MLQPLSPEPQSCSRNHRASAGCAGAAFGGAPRGRGDLARVTWRVRCPGRGAGVRSYHAELRVQQAHPGAAGSARTVCNRREVSAGAWGQVLRWPEREAGGALHLPTGAAEVSGVSSLQEAA
ncbi:hypothetical protein HispidOSU_021755 [Sigmodon hispidus]